jgi:hypothetical protein
MSQAGTVNSSGGGGGSGTVTDVTGTLPIVITGTPTVDPNVTINNATTTTVGAASFNSTEFTVTSGAVSSKAITINTSGTITGGGTVNLGGSITLTGSAGTDTALTPFIVGPSFAGYSTVSAAITAAVAAGASASTPAMVFMQMTSTTENVTIPSGIYVCGLCPDVNTYGAATQTPPFSAAINGTVTFSAGASNCGMANITVTPASSNDAIDIGAACSVSLTNVTTNTLTGLGLNLSTSYAIVYAKNCFFAGNSHNLYVEHPSSFENCFFSGAVAYYPDSSIDFKDCFFDGGFTSEQTNSDQNLFVRCTFGNDSNTLAYNLTNAGTPDLLIDCIINSTHTPQCINSSDTHFSNNKFSNISNNGYTSSPLVVPTTQGNMIPGIVSTTASTVLTAYNYYAGINYAGASTVTLGCKFTDQIQIVKDQSGSASTNPITISPNTGTIDGASTKIIAVNYGSFSFRFDGTNYWTI